MDREAFIKTFDSAFIGLVTDKKLEDYNLGYTAGLLYQALVNGTITLQEYGFLAKARYHAVWEGDKI